MIQMPKPNSTAVEIHGKFGITESCPTGTVPLRRTRKDEELIASRNFTLRVHLKDSQEKLPSNPHVADIGVTADGHEFIGAQVLMVALPNIPPNGVSAGQVILASGIGSPPGISIHFGWIINPQLHGDNRPHLFTYWTSGNHGKKGCLNSECKGYVQVSSMLAPGMTIPLGKGSIKAQCTPGWETGNWLLVLEGQHPEVLGYFPKEIFNNMKSFSVVYCGGWAYGPIGTLSPPMGSGVFAGSPGACQFKQFGLKRVGSNDYLPPGPDAVKVYANLPDFYSNGSFENDGGADGYEFQFGGPGGYNETSDISGASEHISGTSTLFCNFLNLDGVWCFVGCNVWGKGFVKQNDLFNVNKGFY